MFTISTWVLDGIVLQCSTRITLVPMLTPTNPVHCGVIATNGQLAPGSPGFFFRAVATCAAE